ncbi:putative hydrolase YxeP [Variibacter gotjawalensis]|uniref:Putative hydrolase YxeP n=1 Tax=Variibacter gotjawalensis TaxID=1333996 RepID=A0A0S3PW38_9BRAD|nr:M20/M25/M40 family metallo-hydrolase [Variibacter gotjawalensis]NIK45940.1 metal-dependent amidase/aminoacylase/carboxypeptidase family protein [Variibacter gotjawalensis]BAT60114.1 putative hydrolase YxeP [Variibacter gotjawalensis]
MTRIGEIAESVAVGMRGRVQVEWGEFPYPAVYNDAALVERMAPSLARAAPKAVRMDYPASGSEDFSFFSNIVPGLFFFVGIAAPDDKEPAPNHSPRFRVEEAGLIHGLRGMLHLVADYTGSGTA